MIQSETADTGGPGLNMAVDLARLGCGFGQLVGLVGDDAHGRLALDTCAALGIDTAGVGVLPGMSTSYTDVMIERSTGRRTFFHFQGANGRLGRSSSTSPAPRPGSSTWVRPGCTSGWTPTARTATASPRFSPAPVPPACAPTWSWSCVEPERIRALAGPCLAHLDTIMSWRPPRSPAATTARSGP